MAKTEVNLPSTQTLRISDYFTISNSSISAEEFLKFIFSGLKEKINQQSMVGNTEKLIKCDDRIDVSTTLRERSLESIKAKK